MAEYATREWVRSQLVHRVSVSACNYRSQKILEELRELELRVSALEDTVREMGKLFKQLSDECEAV